MKELTHGIKFAGVWEAGALVKRVEVLHNKTKVLLQFVPTVPTRVTSVTSVLGGDPHGASLGTKECGGELGYCNKCYPEVLLCLKSAFH